MKLKFTDRKSKYKINSFPINNDRGEFIFFSSFDSFSKKENELYSKDFFTHNYAINGNVHDFSSCSKVSDILNNKGQNDFATFKDTFTSPLKEAREQFEKEYLTIQLKKNHGNISKTADFIGMERSALHRKLKQLGIKGIN